MSRYIQRHDNEAWTEKSAVPFKLACCHCGLVHRVVLVAGRKGTPIGIAAAQDRRATSARRRAHPKQSRILPVPTQQP